MAFAIQCVTFWVMLQRRRPKCVLKIYEFMSCEKESASYTELKSSPRYHTISSKSTFKKRVCFGRVGNDLQ